jgi:hypothetical protein
MQTAGGTVTASEEKGQAARERIRHSAMIPVNREGAGGNAH